MGDPVSQEFVGSNPTSSTALYFGCFIPLEFKISYTSGSENTNPM